MAVQTAASPGISSGNLRKRIALLNALIDDGFERDTPILLSSPHLAEAYREHIYAALEFLNNELGVNEAQLQLALEYVDA